MRLALALVGGVLGAIACGNFDAGDAPATETEDAGSDGGKTTKPKDAGGASDTSTPEAPCRAVIEHPFDTEAFGGWEQQNAGGALMVVPGPDGVSALRVQAQSNGSLAKAYYDRTVTYAGIRSVHAEYDFAFDHIDPTAAFGCVTNLARSAPFGEARLELVVDSSGFSGAGGFGTTTFTDMDMAALTLPAPNTWTHVIFDLSLAEDGNIERKLTFGGEEHTLTPFMPSGAGDFDSVHVLCGIVGIGGSGSYASVYMKQLVVTACKAP